MKILVAMDSFKESMTAMEACIAVENGFRKVSDNFDIIKVPMADGGEGTVQSLVDATGGKIINVEVSGPLGEKVQAFYGILGDGETAVIEMAAASGLALVPSNKRNPLYTDTFGTGELIVCAVGKGVKKIILGIGGSATNDAGVGMVRALGGKFFDKLGNETGFNGSTVGNIARIDLSGMADLSNVNFLVACDVDNPLTGERGASHVFGPQKGATPEIVEELDNNLKHFAYVIKEQLGVDVDTIPGAGAAGGLGAASIAFLNAKLARGVDIVVDTVGLDNAMKGVELVITGEGRIDNQTPYGKTPMGVAVAAKKHNVPVIALAGSLGAGYEGVYSVGIDAAFSIMRGACVIETALKEGVLNMENLASNIARLLLLQGGKNDKNNNSSR